MLKLCRVTKVKVLFLVLAYIFNCNLFEFSVAILEKGLFSNMKQLEVLLLLPGWDASPSEGYPQQYVAGTHLYTWVKRNNVEQTQPCLEPPTFTSSNQRFD